MNSVSISMVIKKKVKENIIIVIGSIILIYLLVSLYFGSHFYLHTVINGVNVSLKAHQDVERLVKNYIDEYELLLIERDGETEELTSQEIGMLFNKANSISKIYQKQNPFLWIGSFFKDQKFYVKNLYVFDMKYLINKVNGLNCVNKQMIEPQNVSFKYSNGTYQLMNEVYGNKIIKEKLLDAIKINLLKGKARLDLNEKRCYENPKYTIRSSKTMKTKNLLNKYVSTRITYKFGTENEILDGATIQQWLSVDENLEVVINKTAIGKYVKALSKKYDTVGIARNFKASTGKIIEVKGGLYGWKINQKAETNALSENIKLGKVIEMEPSYTQKALSRDGNEIGNTYLEINITRQHVWFYKDGKLITQGSVVTGNPNKGNATVLGTYMLNYKLKDATLRGLDYEVGVKYWMPFYGNMGIHDASWRAAFGGEIYKKRGTHGCVNAPLYLAKKIFENIKEGIPVICYEE